MNTRLSGMRAMQPVSLAALVILAVLFTATTAGATDHSGHITGNETWLAADNPHNVTAHLTVDSGASLTLGPGVEVYLGPNVQLQVYGTLTAAGIAGNEVTFDRSGGSAWYGLYFLSSGHGSLTHCEVRGASYGVSATATTTIALTDVAVSGCTYGFYDTGGTLSLAGTTVSDCTSYGLYCNSAMPTFLDGACAITNSATGFFMTNLSAVNLSMPLAISNSTTVGLRIANSENVTLDNLTLTGNTGNHGAIRLEDVGEFTLGAGNTIGGAGLENSWPVTLTAGSYPSATCVIPTTGNTNNDIQVTGSGDHSGTWRVFSGLDYVVTGSTSFLSGSALTIADGVVVRFNASQSLVFYGSATAVGTPGGGISFLPNTASNWYGLRFLSGSSGTLAYCTVEQSNYGVECGTDGTVSIAHTILRDGLYGVYQNNGTLNLTDVEVRDCSSYGVYDNGGEIEFLDDNTVIDNCHRGLSIQNMANLDLDATVTIRNNDSDGLILKDCEDAFVDNLILTGNSGNHGAIFMDDVGAFTLGAGNAIGGTGLENTWPLTITAGSFPSATCVIPTAGNTNNDIQVTGNGDHTGTWRLFSGLDYVVTGSVSFLTGSGLTIEDNVVVRLNANQSLVFYGSLTAVGTPGGGISFQPNTASNWYGLRFLSSGSGSLDHCAIEQASYGVDCGTDATVSVARTTIRNGSYGLYHTSGTLNLTDVQILDCSSYGLYENGVQADFLDANTVIDNCNRGLWIQNIPNLVLDATVTIRNNDTEGLAVKDCDTPTVDHLILTGNSGNHGAILMDDVGEFTLGAGNVIGGTGLENTWPLTLAAGAYPSASCVVPATGNTNNDIQVNGGSSARTGTWRKLPDHDYVLTGTSSVSAGGQLTIADEVVLRLANAVSLDIYGTLVVAGSAGHGVLMTDYGTYPWYGLRFLNGGQGIVDHCTLETATYGIYVTGPSSVTLSNALLHDCNYGLYVFEGSAELLNNTITANNYGVYVDDATLVLGDDLSEWNDIYDNGGGQPGRNLRNAAETDVYASYVYWGPTYWWDIETTIWDVRDDETLGKVHYIPWVNQSHTGLYSAVDDDDETAIPARFAVYQNYPNPFNPSTTIAFDLARAQDVSLRIYDVAGHLVRTLIDGPLPAAAHRIPWRGTDDGGRTVASGVYVYRLTAGDRTETRQMVLVQ